jgi:hypothetical protein
MPRELPLRCSPPWNCSTGAASWTSASISAQRAESQRLKAGAKRKKAIGDVTTLFGEPQREYAVSIQTGTNAK